MSIRKLRTAAVVFLVGFALGISVFAASRLFVRSVLNNDAIRAAQELAAKLGSGESAASSSALSSVIRYTYFNLDGKVIVSAAPGVAGAAGPMLSAGEMHRLTDLATRGGAVVESVPFLTRVLGLSELPIRRVAVPVATDGKIVGSLLVEADQTAALQSLTHAFSIVAIVTLGLAVLAIVSVALVVTRGRGFRERKVFDPAAVAHDPLTNVPTRAGLIEILDDAVERASAADQQVLLMVVDIDRFSGVNAVWGHDIGDKVLKLVADRLKPFATGPAGVARTSGAQFAVIVEGEHNMRQLADQIRGALGEPFEVDDASIIISASIGAALYPINAEGGEVLFRAGSSAVAKAKSLGRNALAVFDTEMKERMQRSEALERDLRQALEREEFVVFYQPQVEISTGSLRGYEALVRWERPGEGILAPRDFLTVAEDTGLIRPIGEWVLRKACADATSWLDSGLVSVTLSAVQFRSQETVECIAKVLQETGLPAERLEIGVPESLLIDCTPEVMDALKRLKALGVRVAMDDFGSGYSGLASLTRFSFDRVKISRSFVGQLTEDASVAAIVASVVALGRTLSAEVAAEGVETSQQVALLKAAGCTIVQGFRFGTPERGVGHAHDASQEKGRAEILPESAGKTAGAAR